MTVTQIIAELVLETGGDADDSALSSRWLSFLTAALRKFPDILRSRAISATSSATLAAGASTISKPTGFEYPKTAYRLDGSLRIPITFVPDSTFNAYYTTELGAPQFCRLNGSLIEFDRPADKAYTLGFDFYKDVSEGLAGSDTIERRLIEPAKEYAKGVYYLDYEEDKDGKDIKHFAMGQSLLDSIEERDMEQELGSHVSDV